MSYNKFDSPNPIIGEFRDKFNKVAYEVSTDGTCVDSHPSIPARVLLEVENSNDSYEIVGIDVAQLIGCGCWSDVIIMARKIDETTKQRKV